jgi:hypothetical protein
MLVAMVNVLFAALFVVSDLRAVLGAEERASAKQQVEVHMGNFRRHRSSRADIDDEVGMESVQRGLNHEAMGRPSAELELSAESKVEADGESGDSSQRLSSEEIDQFERTFKKSIHMLRQQHAAAEEAEAVRSSWRKAAPREINHERPQDSNDNVGSESPRDGIGSATEYAPSRSDGDAPLPDDAGRHSSRRDMSFEEDARPDTSVLGRLPMSQRMETEYASWERSNARPTDTDAADYLQGRESEGGGVLEESRDANGPASIGGPDAPDEQIVPRKISPADHVRERRQRLRQSSFAQEDLREDADDVPSESFRSSHAREHHAEDSDP